MANELKIRVVFDTGGADKPLGDLPPKIKAVEGSLKDLENQWKKLDQLAKSQYAVGSPQQVQAIANASMAYKRYQEAVAQTSTIVAQNTRVSANAGMTLQALNYTIRDSPYFFRDFSLGILAVGNNLNPLIDGMIRMNKEAKDAGTTLGKTLVQSLSGPAGLVFAFSILVSVLQAVTFAMAKAKDAASAFKGVADELISLDNPFENWSFVFKPEELDKMIGVLDKRIENIGVKRRAQIQSGELGGIIDWLEQVFAGEDTAEENVKNRLTTLKSNLEATREISKLFEELGKKPTIKGKEPKERPLEPNIFDIKPEDVDAFTKAVIKSIDEQEDAFLDYELNRYKTEQDYAEKIKTWKTQFIEDDYKLRIQKIEDAYQKERELILENKKLGLLSPEDALTALVSLGQATEMTKSKTERKKSDEDVAKIKAIDDSIRGAISSSNSLGDALFSAFIQGKQGVDEFLKSLLLAVAKMALMNVLTSIFLNALTGGLPIPSVGSAPDLLPSIPKPNMSMASSTQSVTSRLDAMNLNMMNNQPIVLIEANVSGVEFTKKIVNPSQVKLAKSNTRTQRI